jgi:transcriptional regulator of aromatic amino acid metabolism
MVSNINKTNKCFFNTLFFYMERIDYMNDSFNKKLSELLGKMDEKILQAKISSALEMLNNGEYEEIAKKINKMDKDELIEKIDTFDESKLKGLNINKEEIKQKINSADIDRLAMLIGEKGDILAEKFKNLLNKI